MTLGLSLAMLETVWNSDHEPDAGGYPPVSGLCPDYVQQ